MEDRGPVLSDLYILYPLYQNQLGLQNHCITDSESDIPCNVRGARPLPLVGCISPHNPSPQAIVNDKGTWQTPFGRFT